MLPRNHRSTRWQWVVILGIIGPLLLLIAAADTVRNYPPLQTPQQALRYEVVVPNLEIPWGFVRLPDKSWLITERSGQLIHYTNGQKTAIEGLPEIYVAGQGGLLDIALHPEYETTGWIYLTLSSPAGTGEGGNTALIRGKLEADRLIEVETLYKASPNTTSGTHFGSRIAFDWHNHVYFSVGDRYQRELNPQSLTRDGGKVYRLCDDGSIPDDNPFLETPLPYR